MIGEGTKIDNLVQIAHGVVIGKHCVCWAQSGMAGSSSLGDFVVVGGCTAIKDHCQGRQRRQIAGKSGVIGRRARRRRLRRLAGAAVQGVGARSGAERLKKPGGISGIGQWASDVQRRRSSDSLFAARHMCAFLRVELLPLPTRPSPGS